MSEVVENAPAADLARPAPARLTWREKRWERRRRRRVFEEVLGWIFVPIIVVVVYWSVTSGLAAIGIDLGTTVETVRQLAR